MTRLKSEVHHTEAMERNLQREERKIEQEMKHKADKNDESWGEEAGKPHVVHMEPLMKHHPHHHPFGHMGGRFGPHLE